MLQIEMKFFKKSSVDYFKLLSMHFSYSLTFNHVPHFIFLNEREEVSYLNLQNIEPVILSDCLLPKGHSKEHARQLMILRVSTCFREPCRHSTNSHSTISPVAAIYNNPNYLLHIYGNDSNLIPPQTSFKTQEHTR